MDTQRVSLRYGTGRLELDVERRLFAGLHDARGASASHPAPERASALEGLAAAGLPAAAAGRRVGLLVADGTRAQDPGALLAGLDVLLAGAREVELLVCTGTHDPASAVNRRLAAELGAALRRVADGPLRRASVVLHDARRHPLRVAGRTRRGTPVEVSERLAACQALLILSDVKPHYFAGYSNPTKYVVPGLAGLETARANHSLALEPEAAAGRHPWHPDPARRANPLASDLVEAFELAVGARPHFALAGVESDAGPLGVWGGTTRAATERAIEAADARLAVRMTPERFCVVSPGGAPHDESLYTAQRALELTRAAWRPGGEVLFLAECPDGIGPPRAREHFFEPLTRPLAEVVAGPREGYVLYGHKAPRLAALLRSAGAIWFHGALPAAELRRAHFRPAADAQAVLDDWRRRAGPDDRIAFVDEASRLFVREG